MKLSESFFPLHDHFDCEGVPERGLRADMPASQHQTIEGKISFLFLASPERASWKKAVALFMEACPLAWHKQTSEDGPIWFDQKEGGGGSSGGSGSSSSSGSLIYGPTPRWHEQPLNPSSFLSSHALTQAEIFSLSLITIGSHNVYFDSRRSTTTNTRIPFLSTYNVYAYTICSSAPITKDWESKG